MRRALIAVALGALFGCNPVFAQQMGSPTPGLGATSPLGMVPGSPVPPLGIPMGATGLASPGLSPAPTGNGTTCSVTGTSGSSTTFDGGGMAMGTGASLPGSGTMSGTCGTSSSGIASSSAATSPTSPGGGSRTGIPLGSIEIGNAGVSAAPVVPTPSPYPTTTTTPFPTLGSRSPCSTTGSSMSSTGC